VNTNACDDGNLCTQDSCKADGQCSHQTVSCDDSNACTEDVCVESVGCTYVPASDPCQSTSCDDGNACTKSDTCATGACKGTPIANCCTKDTDCSDGNDCTDDACTGNVCFNTQKTCTSENACLAPICNTQGGCSTAPVSCDDANVCTDDSCDPQNGCTFTPTQNPPEPTEVSCGDTLDNDCDGLMDASDPDCPQCSIPHGTAGPPVPDGSCTIQTCDSGWANCDGLVQNGCESDLTNNPSSCGSCGTICAFPNATAGCSGGQCTVAACTPGFQNCDGIPQNGCESLTMQCQ
jgi:hypothetical protein